MRTNFRTVDGLFGQSSDSEVERNSIRKSSRRVETDMDITPMIDITFLLLIFFLVVSRMDDSSAIELPVARNGTAITVDDSVVLTVIHEGNRVALFQGDNTAAESRIIGADAAQEDVLVADYVEKQLSSEVPSHQVLIRATKDIEYRQISRLISVVGSVPGAEIYLAVLEED